MKNLGLQEDELEGQFTPTCSSNGDGFINLSYTLLNTIYNLDIPKIAPLHKTTIIIWYTFPKSINMYLCGRNRFRTSTKKNFDLSQLLFIVMLFSVLKPPFTYQQKIMKN